MVPTATSLGTWVATQRHMFKKNELGSDRRDLLDEIEFVWSVDYYDSEKSFEGKHWEDMYKKLVVFRERGHCDVPIDYEDDVLAKWVRTQRRSLSSKWLHASRKAKLDEIGFTWGKSHGSVANSLDQNQET